MAAFEEHYVVDQKGNCVGVLLDIQHYEQLLEELEELDCIRAYDAARPDGLPLGDLALRRAVSRVYFGGTDIDDRQLSEFSQRWSPWRAYATVYLFSALRTGMA